MTIAQREETALGEETGAVMRKDFEDSIGKFS
jgi:hypothetical protein